MKKLTILFIFGIISAFASSTFAQVYPGDIAGAKADYLYKKLKLTNEQYTKVYSIYFETQKKVDAMMLNKMADNAKKKQMEDLRNSTRAEIEKLLTKEQKDKWGTVKEKVCKVKYVKPVKKVAKSETKEEVKKDEKKDVKKEEKK